MTVATTKPTRTQPTAPPPIPSRHPINGETLAHNNNDNGKARKQADEPPPELPPKTTRLMPVTGKTGTPVHPMIASAKGNPIVNKENQHAITPESEPVSSSNQPKLVQRHKTKNNRRKMTEEEAIQELGL